MSQEIDLVAVQRVLRRGVSQPAALFLFETASFLAQIKPFKLHLTATQKQATSVILHPLSFL